jgi:hypothetical protein
VRQTFRLEELLDMILSVAGKDPARVQQLLHSGTVVYHFYRYSWTAIDASDAELAAALGKFPDAQPSRPFSPQLCSNALFDAAGENPRHLLELDKARASNRRLFRGQSFWDALLEIAVEDKPAYQTYSYGRRADLYRLYLDGESSARIEEAATNLATGKLRAAMRVLEASASVLFVCPR